MALTSVRLGSLHRVLQATHGFEFGDGDVATLSASGVIERGRLAISNLLQDGRPRPVLDSVDDPDVSLLQSFFTQNGEALGGDLVPTPGGWEVMFDNQDAGWVRSLRDWLKRLNPRDFIRPGAAEPLPADSRIAVLADWGTGLYGAPVCARSIAAERDAPHMVLHLGDIYYAGVDQEVTDRFLAHWPMVPNASNRALNGNHEMYAGGQGYFGTLLRDPRFRQESSCFAQVNGEWLIVGLDTAYLGHDLYGNQVAWLTQLANQYADHRIVLFSHHQPFSRFEGQGLELLVKLDNLLRTGRVAAWYWGHEHSCVRYDQHSTYRFYGRCVGHGGFPYFRFANGPRTSATRWVSFEGRNIAPAGVVLDGPNEYIQDDPMVYGPNGWLMLEMRGRALHESYRAADGRELDAFDIPADR